ncbi:MAG: hypothetical protein NZ483_03015 [Verrucomicrobiae bacterium]|nr:hypothetical protein [Verrucomicrobiae bacterium]
MNRKLQWIIGGVSLGVIVVCGTTLALWRTREAREFGRPHRVRTYGGTNYVVRLSEVTIGRSDAGPLVMVRLIFANPNPFDVTLERKWFILMDGDRDYFLPLEGATQPATIHLPAHGVVDNEMLVYHVDEDSFSGALALFAGHHYMVMLKEVEPYGEPLNLGEYRSFRRVTW